MASSLSVLVADRMKNRRLVLAILTLLYGAIASIVSVRLLSTYMGKPAVHWMFFVRGTHVPPIEDLPAFWKELRTGIPPVLATAEIVTCNLFGDFGFITVYGYRIAIILVFWLSFVLLSESFLSTAVSFVSSIVFLLVTGFEHRRMPEVYDIFAPLCFLLFLLCLKLATKEVAYGRDSLCLAAGFFLSMVELLRPYVIAILPFLLLFAYLGLRRHGRGHIAYFLIPLLLFSGSWHLKLLYFNDGQIIWSNFSGYNMIRCWRQLYPDMRGIEYRDPLRGSGAKREYINSPAFARSSIELRREMTPEIVGHPIRSAMFVLGTRIPEVLNGYSAKKMPFVSPVLQRLHPPIIWVSALLMYIYLLFAVARSVQKRTLDGLAEPECILAFYVISSVFIFAIGEYGEEFRFLISLSPLFAAFPVSKVGELAVAVRRHAQGRVAR